MPSLTRVMYVEDVPLVREITCELLARDDREVRAFATAEDALAEFERNTYDVVIIASGYPLDLRLDQIGVNVRSIVKPFEGAEIDSLLDSMLERP